MKSEARKAALAARRRLSSDLRSDFSSIIHQKLFDTEWYTRAKNILCYSSYNSEVDTNAVISDILENDKNLYLPRCIVPKHELKICPVTCVDELRKGAYGIIEPQNEGVSAEIIDLVIVPVVAFNQNRMRIGYGAGYYDRLLSKCNAHTIGLAFSVQQTNFDSFEITDVPLDMIITEREVLI